MPMYGSPMSAPQSRLTLDGPPPAPPDRLKPVMKAPGDDTTSLLGAMNVNGDDTGMSASSPTGRALGGVMMMMNGANLIESVVPGAVAPPVLMAIQQLMVSIPEIVRNMQQMTGPGGLLSSMGAMNGTGAPPMGASPMGMGTPMGEGSPIPM